jgi:hypothetical protein
MKTGTIKYSKEFKNEYGLSEWIGVEYEFDMDHETPSDVYLKAKNDVVSFYSNQKSNTIIERNDVIIGPVITVEKESENERIANTIKCIYGCERLDGKDGLFSYYTIASGNPETLAAYHVVKNKLVKKESQEILDAANELTKK